MTRFSSARLLLPILGSLLFALPASAESIQLSQQGRLADGAAATPPLARGGVAGVARALALERVPGLEERDVRLPVLEAHVNYHKPALYDDELEILTTIEELGRARVRFRYEVRRVGDDAHLATGTTEHAAVGPDGRARRMPPELLELLG